MILKTITANKNDIWNEKQQSDETIIENQSLTSQLLCADFQTWTEAPYPVEEAMVNLPMNSYRYDFQNNDRKQK
jgi:hypothetical protein